MSTGRRWQDIKAEAHRRHPELAEPERQAQARAELDAYVAGHHLKELRKAVGKTQAEIAEILGVSQSRISQIENGDIEAMELETLRAYATALGGHVDITVSVGPTRSRSPDSQISPKKPGMRSRSFHFARHGTFRSGVVACADISEEDRPLPAVELEDGAGAVLLGVADADGAIDGVTDFDAVTVGTTVA